RPRITAPVRTPFTSPERKDRQAMAVGWERARRVFVFFLGFESEIVSEPAHHIAALAQRPAEDVALAIDAIDEGPPRHGQGRPIDQHAQSARGTNRGARPAGTNATCPDVGQPTIAEREIPGRIAQLRPATDIARAQGAGWLIPIAEWRKLFRCDAGQPE